MLTFRYAITPLSPRYVISITPAMPRRHFLSPLLFAADFQRYATLRRALRYACRRCLHIYAAMIALRYR